jgi:hypothetical protein
MPVIQTLIFQVTVTATTSTVGAIHVACGLGHGKVG